jgi:DNA-directed RNA polymerase subunit RPC12/RpoP
MEKKCAVCDKKIEEEGGKLQGTMIKVKEGNKNNLIYVCSECEKDKDYLEKAVIRAA